MLLYIALGAYALVGIIVLVWIHINVTPSESTYLVGLLCDASMLSGFTNVLFIVLWPIWVILIILLIQRDKRRRLNCADPTGTSPETRKPGRDGRAQ